MPTEHWKNNYYDKESNITQNDFYPETTNRELLAPVSDTIQKAHETSDRPTLSGFKLASGKKIAPVSEEAIYKAMTLFKESDKEIKEKTGEISLVERALSDSFGEKTKQSKETAQRDLYEEPKRTDSDLIKEPIHAPLLEIPPSERLARFTTASGKVLAETKEEIKKQVEAIFDSQPLEVKHSADTVLTGRYNTLSHNNDSIRKRPKKSTFGGNQIKPFKSPIIQSNTARTKAAIESKSVQRPRKVPVFNLNAPSKRIKLSDLGRPQQYTRQQLVSKNIPLEIMNMTSLSSRNWEFIDGKWGALQAQEELINRGALLYKISKEWVGNHFGLIVWKLACQVRSYPDEFIKDWKPETVLHQLLYRYEREINQGHCSILKKILEQDDNAAKNMILVISDIIETNVPKFYDKSSRYLLRVTDGWYQMSACIDLRMERSITQKRLRIGHKLSVCGAQLVQAPTAQSPLAAHEEPSQILSLATNGCMPVPWDTRLGYHPRKCVVRNLSGIFEDGGMVTALDVIVCRKFPMLYRESLPAGKSITRTAQEKETVLCDKDFQQTLNPFSSNSTISSENERKVSGYFRVRVCNYRSHSLSDSFRWATLLLINVSKIDHADIEEGRRFKIFFVTPYCPKSRRYPGIYLKTTRMTRWETAKIEKISPYYIPRYISLCSEIYHKKHMLDFDMVVVIMHTSPITSENRNGRQLQRHKLLVTDQSQVLCLIDLYLACMPLSLAQGQVVGLTNIRFEFYDSKYDITCMKTTDESEVSFKGRISYIDKGIQSLKAWTEDNADAISNVARRIHSIVE